MHGNRLESLGWDSTFAKHFQNFQKPSQPDAFPARVISQQRGLYRIQGEQGEAAARMRGRLRQQAEGGQPLPAVGDWVACLNDGGAEKASILTVLPRKSKFSRQAAGRRSQEQVVAANVDTVLLMTSLNHDFNLRRLERYLVLAWESGARPVIVLSKSDLCPQGELENFLIEVEGVACGLPVHPISTLQEEGLEAIDQYLAPGQTVALLGSSGVGKSTLANRLAGHDLLRVREVRSGDDRGRHATTHRQLILLPQGGLLLDTPGMRELQLWEGRKGLSETFEDVESLARNCRFRDCRHQSEPGCAVQEALEQGWLDEARFANYRKLQKEIRSVESRRDQNAALAEKQRIKRLHRHYRQHIQQRRRR